MAPPASPAPQDAIRRELHFFTLYRVFEAALLCLAVFSPAGELLSQPRYPLLAACIALGYLLGACLLFAARRHGRIAPQVLAGIGADILVSTLAIHAMPGMASGIAMMLLFNVGATALLLPLRTGLAMAGAASLALLIQHVGTVLTGDEAARPTAEVLMFSISYLAIATLISLVGKQMRASQALAEHRSSQVANLAEVNELIIRRMRTGVLLVDGDGEIRLANEAAMLQLGDAGEGRRLLATAAPALDARLRRWERDGQHDPTPLQLAADLPEVLPRFARLLAESDQALVFLDDAELASRRAETLTLATLGRFSASLAHEIRNPLAAISYATQLLEESRDIPEADRRLLEIIYQQTRRMNGIVENVLGLARRERAQPEHVDLCEFARQFVAEYRNSHPLEQDVLDVRTEAGPVPCLVDRRQLQQIVTVLVHNALVYGRMPGEPAHVALYVHRDSKGAPLLDVVDHGPGIPDAVAGQLFRPFFTTSGHGTGLGLYIAREMCSANQADLAYVALPAGGACFRVRLAGARAIETA
ncbi:PAS domain-containing sensor histidine kinase [Thermomonas brevis]|uniref:histidine kinase n=1 Tax=Thermomonas brevis TaxID=215691 RepID=A0A7G9QQS7_9GAMM|nr:histidine kinase dimerization/phospho-acceptor domain-containing protein [Thermomonas brevis]QNN45702.1 PAS domain-containing sensor histidine kinase [Thermomonas brevis]